MRWVKTEISVNLYLGTLNQEYHVIIFPIRHTRTLKSYQAPEVLINKGMTYLRLDKMGLKLDVVNFYVILRINIH